jgi:hypothetical protein
MGSEQVVAPDNILPVWKLGEEGKERPGKELSGHWRAFLSPGDIEGERDGGRTPFGNALIQQLLTPLPGVKDATPQPCG